MVLRILAPAGVLLVWSVMSCPGNCQTDAATSNGSDPQGIHPVPSEASAASQSLIARPATSLPAPASAALSLPQVLAIAFERNPSFEEFAANRDAARAEVLQALAYPNPEIEASVGQAKGREEPNETEVEFGVSLVQPIESRLKRRTRRVAAETLEEIVEREEEVFRVTLRAETAEAYYTILYRRHAAELAAHAKQITEEIQAVVDRRVGAGEAAEIDRIKAKVEVLKASRAAQSENRKLASARVVLNALCGGGLPEGFELQDSLAADLGVIDAEKALQSASENHPVLLHLQSEGRKQDAIIAREQAAWRPDLKPGVSAGREFDTDSFAFSLGVEVPIWNRNRGGIAAAQAEWARIRAALAKARLEIERNIQTAMQDYESAREQMAAFSAGLRESAAEALKIETLLYEQGETGFLQLLDARRTAQETEAEYLQAIFDARAAEAELDRAIGIGGNEP